MFGQQFQSTDPAWYLQPDNAQMLNAVFLQQAQNYRPYKGLSAPIFNPKKQMTDREAKLLIVGGLRP